MTEFLQSYMPIVASEMGHLGDNLSGLVHWLMLVLFIGWGTFFIYTLIRFRSSNNPKANYHGITTHYSSYVEVGVVVFEALLLISFAIPGYATVKYDKALEDTEIEVRVIAQQFAWNIHYPGVDGVFGRTDINLVDESEQNFIGIDRSDEFAKDDIILQNQMHIPVNKKIRVDLSSKDVIHNFKLPELRVSQDAIPGMNIPVHFTATTTSQEFLESVKGTPREGKGLEIACAQLCGITHYRMRGYLTVDTEDEYNDWLASEAEYLDFGDDDGDDWGDDDW